MEKGNSILFQEAEFLLCPVRLDFGKHVSTHRWIRPLRSEALSLDQIYSPH